MYFALRINRFSDQLLMETGNMGDKGTRDDSEFDSPALKAN